MREREGLDEGWSVINEGEGGSVINEGEGGSVRWMREIV